MTSLRMLLGFLIVCLAVLSYLTDGSIGITLVRTWPTLLNSAALSLVGLVLMFGGFARLTD